MLSPLVSISPRGLPRLEIPISQRPTFWTSSVTVTREKRNGLVVDVTVSGATVAAEREVSFEMLEPVLPGRLPV